MNPQLISFLTGQSKRWSLFESVANVIVGFMISALVQMMMFIFLDIPATLSQNLLITSVITITSVLRHYTIRRVFNKLFVRYAHGLHDLEIQRRTLSAPPTAILEAPPSGSNYYH